MWRELLIATYPDCMLNKPIRAQEIYFVERTLGVQFPESLRQLLQEANGGTDDEAGWVLWDLMRVEKQNLDLRYIDTHMPVDHLLFFAENRSSDLFGFPVIKKKVSNERVYVWRRDDDSRICVAASLREFLQHWLTGALTV